MQDFKNEMNNINIEPDFLIKFINDFPMGCLYKDSGEKQSKTINILSPLFDIFSKTDLFEIYETLFNMDLVRNNKLKKNISAIIDKLNQLNKYPPIKLYIGNCKDIDYLKKIKTNLSSIKSLNLSFSNNLINEETISFFDLFFTTVEFQNNLIKLNLSRGQITYPDAKILEQINNFKVLEELSIKSIIFDNYNSDNVIILKIKNLKKLYLYECDKYINFENCCSNLITLDIIISGMQKPHVPLKMPNLEKLNMIHFLNNDFINSYFDFNNFKKLKIFYNDTGKGKLEYLPYLNIPSIEEIKLNFKNKTKNENIECFLNLIKIKTLKKIIFNQFNLDDNEISEIEGVNDSVTEISFDITDMKFTLVDLKNKFPNLCKLNIYYTETDYSNKTTYNSVYLRMKNNSKNKLGIKYIDCLNIYFEPYEDLEDIYFNWKKQINLDILPFFNQNFEGKFISLIDLRLYLDKLSVEYLNNLFNNLEKMPNLKEFRLYCYCDEISQEDYQKLIIKVLILKIEFIEFSLRGISNIQELFSIEELKNIYKLFDFNSYKIVKIYKF